MPEQASVVGGEDILDALDDQVSTVTTRAEGIKTRSGDTVEWVVTTRGKMTSISFRFTRPDGTVLTTPMTGREVRTLRDLLWNVPTGD